MKNKNIILCISGSIAAYKALDLVVLLRSAGANVQVLMTEAATRFVSALSFSALSGQKVISNIWDDGALNHINMATAADMIVICPASADIMARLICGLTDDIVTATVLAATCPKLICPAMNDNMYANKATKHNEQILKERGFKIVPSDFGRLASGKMGQGRLAPIEQIVTAIETEFCGAIQEWSTRRVVITAGGTREAIDPVRFISNHSSGKMGFALASAALKHGAKVTLISTVEVPLELQKRTNVLMVESAEEMRKATVQACSKAAILIMAAAVADFKMAKKSLQKIKKEPQNGINLHLVKTADILTSVKSGCFKVGFAAETSDLLQNAQDKLQSKKLDMIVANNVKDGRIFGSEQTQFTVIDKYGQSQDYTEMSKMAAADIIIEKIGSLLAKEEH